MYTYVVPFGFDKPDSPDANYDKVQKSLLEGWQVLNVISSAVPAAQSVGGFVAVTVVLLKGGNSIFYSPHLGRQG